MDARRRKKEGQEIRRRYLPLLPYTQDVGEDTVQLLGAGRLEEVFEQSKQRRLDGLLLIAQGAAVLLHTGATDTAARPGKKVEKSGTQIRKTHTGTPG